jgi:hypothetical protein
VGRLRRQPAAKDGYPSGDLQQERNRLANPVREQLWRYYPALAISDDLATDWFTRTVGRGADTGQSRAPPRRRRGRGRGSDEARVRRIQGDRWHGHRGGGRRPLPPARRGRRRSSTTSRAAPTAPIRLRSARVWAACSTGRSRSAGRLATVRFSRSSGSAPVHSRVARGCRVTTNGRTSTRCCETSRSGARI